jgi:hypothetical protein
VYEDSAPDAAQRHWADEHTLTDDDPVALSERVHASVSAVGADAVNLRVHMPGVERRAIREQIERLGADVVPRLVFVR